MSKFLYSSADMLLSALQVESMVEQSGAEEDEIPEIMVRLKDIVILAFADAILASAMDSDLVREANAIIIKADAKKTAEREARAVEGVKARIQVNKILRESGAGYQHG